jgi:glycosyltransferase involved in cell wall biosynthesis
MKKILIFHQVGGIGGATVTLANVVSCLCHTGFCVAVVCPTGPAQSYLAAAGATVMTPERHLYQFAHQSGFEKAAWHPRFCHDAIRQMLDLEYWGAFIKQQRPDAVHLNAITLAPLALAAKRAGVRVSIMVQETGVRGLLGMRTLWLRQLLSHSMDLVVFISEYDRAWYACQARRVGVVPNWVDERSFGMTMEKAQARAALELPQATRIVLFVGGVCPLKGTAELIEAASELTDLKGLLVLVAGTRRNIQRRQLSRLQRLNLRRRVLSGTDYDSKVAALLRRPGVRRRIRFVGNVREMASLYCAADLVVFPATKPHQARPAIEAGLVGLPVVASDFENLHEFLTDGENALLVPPGNAHALASAVRRILNDEALASRLGQANQARVARSHGKERNAQRLAVMLKEMVES